MDLNTSIPLKESDLPDARVSGRICALATLTERAALQWSNRYPGLIEPRYVSPVTAAFAFSMPWCTPQELLLPLQFELWVFAVDKLIDESATSLDEVEAIVLRLKQVASGGNPLPRDLPSLSLRDIYDRLTDSRLWPELNSLWRQLFDRTYNGIIADWRNQVSAHLPTFDEYVENSDSCQFRLIRLTTWIASGDSLVLQHIDTLMEAAWEGQISSRLTNDLCTYEREKDEKALNAVKLRIPKVRIQDRIQEATHRCAQLLKPSLSAWQRPAIALDRILAFGNAFYEATDFR